MPTRSSMLMQFAADVVERAGCDDVPPDAVQFDHLEPHEAARWLSAAGAPAQAHVETLLAGISDLSQSDEARLSLRLSRLLDGDLTLSEADELLSLLRSAVVDHCKEQIRDALSSYDLLRLSHELDRERAELSLRLSRGAA